MVKEDNIQREGQKGIPVDSASGPTVDPTRNVLDLVRAAVDRIDDLRSAETKRVDEKINSEKEHTREIMSIRADHSSELREAEAKRIDAIRAVDVQAGTARDERATSQAAVLASQVSATAETLRNLVATTAGAATIQLDQITKLLTDRIAALEKAQYEGLGKERVIDPIMTQMLGEIKTLRETQSLGTGRSSGISATVVYIVMAFGLAGTILGIVSFFR